MISCNTRSRRQFRLESLEVRSAPSHIGGLAHLASAVHGLHAAAHVKHYTDTKAADKAHKADRNAGVEKSHDAVTDTSTTSTGTNGVDASTKDNGIQDKAGQV